MEEKTAHQQAAKATQQKQAIVVQDTPTVRYYTLQQISHYLTEYRHKHVGKENLISISVRDLL